MQQMNYGSAQQWLDPYPEEIFDGLFNNIVILVGYISR